MNNDVVVAALKETLRAHGGALHAFKLDRSAVEAAVASGAVCFDAKTDLVHLPGFDLGAEHENGAFEG
jgi:hypothetical protein